jgi:hypothetical protein
MRECLSIHLGKFLVPVNRALRKPNRLSEIGCCLSVSSYLKVFFLAILHGGCMCYENRLVEMSKAFY